jgi:hypothetical protein
MTDARPEVQSVMLIEAGAWLESATWTNPRRPDVEVNIYPSPDKIWDLVPYLFLRRLFAWDMDMRSCISPGRAR